MSCRVGCYYRKCRFASSAYKRYIGISFYFFFPFSFCDKRHWTFIASITLSTNVLLFGVNGYYNPFQYWCWIGLERFLNGWEQLLAKLIYCINIKLVDTQIFMSSETTILRYIMMIVSFNKTIFLTLLQHSAALILYRACTSFQTGLRKGGLITAESRWKIAIFKQNLNP